METEVSNNETKTSPGIKLQFDIRPQTPFRPQESGSLKGFLTIAVYYGPELSLKFDAAVFDNGKSRWVKLPQKLGKRKAFPILEASKKMHELIDSAALDSYQEWLRLNDENA